MLSATSPVTAGTLRVLGKDPARDAPDIRSRIFAVPHTATLFFDAASGEASDA